MTLPAGVVALTAEQMRRVDEGAVAAGVPVSAMMDQAADRVLELASRLVPGLPGKRIVVLVGVGNNGGGGAAAARKWLAAGARPHLVLARKRAEYRGAVAEHVAAFEAAGGKVLEGFQEKAFEDAALVLDALLGYGAQGPPTGSYSLLIKAANFSLKPLLSLDLPSGLDPTTGALPGPCIRARATLTLAMPKTGLLAPGAQKVVGELWLGDVGVPVSAYQKLGLAAGNPFRDGPLLRLA